jgi:flagellar basal body P-ring formation protein FlgA
VGFGFVRCVTPCGKSLPPSGSGTRSVSTQNRRTWLAQRVNGVVTRRLRGKSRGRLASMVPRAGAPLAHTPPDMNLPSKTRHRLRCLAAVSLLSAIPHANAEGVQSLKSIRTAAEGFVRSQMPAGAQGMVITAAELDSRLRLAQCSQALHAALVSGAQLGARMAVGVSCGHGATWTVYVPVTVESEIPALVLRVPAPRGARLKPSDVATEKRRVIGLAVGYVTDVDALARNTLIRPLAAGAVLTTDALLPDFIVKRGEAVTLLAAVSGIEVRAPGLALSDGRDGARIKVQNLGSLKIVEGVVDATHVIHVTP